ncbi:MAG: hypothetical protein V3U67_06380 [Gemmatimonadota bacterium]
MQRDSYHPPGTFAIALVLGGVILFVLWITAKVGGTTITGVLSGVYYEIASWFR